MSDHNHGEPSSAAARPNNFAFERLLGLQSVTAELSAAIGLDDIAGVVVESGVRMVGAAAGTLMLVSEDGTALEPLATRGYPHSTVKEFAPRFPIDAGSPAGVAVLSGEPLWLRSTAEFAARFPQHLETHLATGYESLVAAPLRPFGRTIGVVGLSFAEARDFSEAERAFILTLTGQAAFALERSLLYEREHRARMDAERANRLLKASEERFRIFSEISTDYTFGHFVEPDGSARFDWVSDSITRRLGVTAETASLDGWAAYVHPDDRQVVERQIEQTLAGARDVSELRLLARDGDVRWVRSYTYPIWDPTYERVIYVYGAAQDITDQKRAEMALRESEERFRATFESAGTGMAIVNLKGEVIRPNRKLAEILGYEPDELVGRSYLEMTHPDDVETDTRLLGELLAGEVDRCELEKRYVRKDGATVWAHLMVTLVDDAEGRPKYGVAVIEDVSERRAVERQRTELLERERQAREEAETASRMKDEFLATVSHELRSPLNAILGWARLLAAGTLGPPEAERAVEIIERNASAQAQLIEDLLDVSRIISGKLRLRPGAVNLVTVVRAAVDSVQPAADAKEIDLRVETGAEVVPVLGDTDRLRQVVWNLLSNAIKFTPRGGKASVRLDAAGETVRVVVSDAGKGIAREFLPFVFEPFRQHDGSPTRRFGGLGLGLSIVRHLVEAHGGDVAAESEGEGRGATFTISLPLLTHHESSARADHREGGDMTGDPALASIRLESLSVVVVDDEHDTRELLATILRQHGAEVRALGSAPEAYDAIAISRPNVLLADIAMPGEDGYSLMRRVRRLDGASAESLPAAALTAYARSEDRDEAFAAGFQLHVPKPVDPEHLVAVVETLVGRR